MTQRSRKGSSSWTTFCFKANKGNQWLDKKQSLQTLLGYCMYWLYDQLMFSPTKTLYHTVSNCIDIIVIRLCIKLLGSWRFPALLIILKQFSSIFKFTLVRFCELYNTKAKNNNNSCLTQPFIKTCICYGMSFFFNHISQPYQQVLLRYLEQPCLSWLIQKHGIVSALGLPDFPHEAASHIIWTQHSKDLQMNLTCLFTFYIRIVDNCQFQPQIDFLSKQQQPSFNPYIWLYQGELTQESMSNGISQFQTKLSANQKVLSYFNASIVISCFQYSVCVTLIMSQLL